MKSLALVVALAGCSPAFTGPTKADEQKALSIVWDQRYDMETAARPSSITWWAADGCGEDQALNGVTLRDYCADTAVYNDGRIFVRWRGSFHGSGFADALGLWRQFLLTGDLVSPESADTEHMASEANATLAHAGL